MQKMTHLILVLVCAISFTTHLSAQDEEQDPQIAQKATKASKSFKRRFGAAELTEEQQAQLQALIYENWEGLSSSKAELRELVSKKDAKTIRRSVGKAVRSGVSKAEAHRTALAETDLSEEDQARAAALQTRLDEIEQGIIDQIAATFSEEQRTAMQEPRPKKNRKEKDRKEKEPEEE